MSKLSEEAADRLVAEFFNLREDKQFSDLGISFSIRISDYLSSISFHVKGAIYDTNTIFNVYEDREVDDVIEEFEAAVNKFALSIESAIEDEAKMKDEHEKSL